MTPLGEGVAMGELVRIDGGHEHGAGLPSVGEMDLIAAFLSGRKPTTLRAYGRDLADFAAFVGRPSPASAVDLLTSAGPGPANHVALAYKAHLMARKLAPATIARRLASLRSVVKLARTLGKVSWALDVEAPQAQRLKETAGPGDAGWRALLDLAKAEAASGGPIGVRNLCLIRMLHDLGLRRSELVGIDLADLAPDLGSVAIIGKGRHEATRLTIPGPVKAAVDAWMKCRGADPGPLFTRLDRARTAAGRLTADGVYKVVGGMGRRAGLARRVRPHGMRHHAITCVLDRNGGDLRSAARFSRHKDIRMLATYDDNRMDLAGRMAGLISDE